MQEIPAYQAKQFLRSKEDLLRVLKFVKQLYLPPDKACSLHLLRAIICGEKKVSIHQKKQRA